MGLLVEADPAAWLPGPLPGTEDRWILGAVHACALDFGLEEGSTGHTWLAETLTEFARRPLECEARFLRMRGPESAPVVALAHLRVGGEAFDALADLGPDLRWYDPPRVETVDDRRGLRRAVGWVVADGMIRALVRYHRRVEDWQCDLVHSSAGLDLRTTSEALVDLDSLAAASWLVDEQGRRR